MAAYLHKKFKKLASVDTQQENHERILSEKSPSPPAPVHDTVGGGHGHLKHSVGSMVASNNTSETVISDYRNRNSNVVCPKPSVLEKHVRLRTNSAKEEYDVAPPPVILRPDDPHHPAPGLPHPGLVLLPSHLVKPGIINPHELAVPRLAAYPPAPAPYRVLSQPTSHPGLRFIDAASLPIINGHHIVPGHPLHHPDQPQHESFTPHSPHVVRHRPPAPPQDKPEPLPYPHFPGLPQHPIREPVPVRHYEHVPRDNHLPVETREAKKTNAQINAELEKRINKVISENQAIVETGDPFWKGRYMRQSSREERKQSLTSTSVSSSSSQEHDQHHPHHYQDHPAGHPRHPTKHSLASSVPQNLSTSLQPSNFISNNVPQPPRPDSNIPLNLSDSGRKRKSPENPLIDAHSVKEVWLNSQKKGPANISHLEDIASKIEAKLRSSENPFHPDNPEGSIIKDLLLKTRQGHLIVAPASELRDREMLTVVGHNNSESPRRLSESSPSVNLTISPPSKSISQLEHNQNTVGIPIPKNFLPPSTKPSGDVGASLYQCNLCQVTFKSLESIEIHQSHYCKNTKHPMSEVLRPNSTVTHLPVTRDTRGEPVVRISPSIGDRRKPDGAPAPGEPPVKRSRSDSYPSVHTAGPANITVTNMGLLQIVASGVQTPVRTSAISTIPGIPTPNLSGVLTGIKSQPLFSLPGVRPCPELEQGVVAKRPGEDNSKPVTFVLGIPGPHSQPLSVVRSPPVTTLAGVIPVPVEHSFLKPPVNMAPLTPVTPVSINCLQSPSKVGGSPAGHRLNFASPQRKYEFSAATKLESPQKPLESSGSSTTSPDSQKTILPHKPERPDSLALPPGALFKKKEVHLSGATLISPETPRPKKAYVLSYQNGTAYTFLGLKCSTRVFFCSIHKPQPNYVQLEKNSQVSMYSNWKVVAKDSHPSGHRVDSLGFPPLTPQVGMSAYSMTTHSSLHGVYSTAAPKKSLMITTHSSRWHEKKASSHSNISSHIEDKRTHSTAEEGEGSKQQAVRTVEGGYKAADDNYTYIRGRGRGKYICDSCGIRCKKPSMLKKHIRTHTNVRPYTCKYCNFSFKTKGNLTKHMKSKAHSKKCVELGIVPVPTSADDQQMDDSKSSGEIALAGDSDTDDCDDADDMDEDDDDGDNPDEQFDDAGQSESKVRRSIEEEDSSSMLGLAPRTPRFATYPFSLATPSPSPAPPPVNLVTAVTSANDGSCLPGPESNSMPGHGQPSPRLPEQGTSKIWSIANMTDADQARVSRPGDGQRQAQDLSANHPAINITIRQNAADILSPVTESATILSYIDKTSLKVQSAHDALDSPVDTGLKNYLQERAAIRAKQQSQSYDGPENKVVIKEEQNTDMVITEKHDNNKNKVPTASFSTEFSNAYSHTDTIPQNVTMNVKDMPPMNCSNNPPPTPEFSIPHISKADSPLRKGPPQPQLANDNMKIRTPESINQQINGGARSSDSPASNSSADNETVAGAGGQTKTQQDSEKGSMISNPQEIFQTNEDGKSVCGICKKVFSKPSQLRLHVNIHYFERPFRCDACAVSFRTKGHLQKHKRSVGHFNKVNINATFGAPSTDNPRPFKCGDCMIAFRIHGHLAKHLRSKMHIMKLECIGKLPIGMYAEMERLGTNLNEIDTTDCENALESLQQVAVKLYEKDPSKLTSIDEQIPTVSTGSDLSDEEDSNLGSLDIKENNTITIKEEPMEVGQSMVEIVPNMTIPPPRPAPGSSMDRQSYSSGLSGPEEQSTDSDTESSHALKCQHCSQSFSDMKSLQIHTFLDHHHHQGRGGEVRTPPAAALNLSQIRHTSPSPDNNPIPCQICGLKLPNQQIYQQHLQTHAAFRPYVCNLCDAGFTSLVQLETHSRLHAK